MLQQTLFLLTLAVFTHGRFVPNTSPTQSNDCPVTIAMGENTELTVKVSGETWLDSVGASLHSGEWFSTTNNTITVENTNSTSGSDVLGSFKETAFDLVTKSSVKWQVRVRDYTPEVCLVVFEQHFPDGVTNTAIPTDKNNGIASVFPDFEFAEPKHTTLGYMGYHNQMLGGMSDGTKFGELNSTAQLPTGAGAGPYAFFDKNTNNAIVVGSWERPISTNSVYNNNNNNRLGFGAISTAVLIPKGFTVSVGVVASGSGVGSAVVAYGRCLTAVNGKTLVEKDVTTTHLGYSTDNGAYYYYFTGVNKTNNATYETVLEALKTHAEIEGLPFKYILLDSWWYFRGSTGGVTTWEPRPDVFPSGLNDFHKNTDWAVQAHNRYWDSGTPYAKQNGGQFNFVVEEHYAVPNDPALWDYLFRNASQWGMEVYEQDWLHNEWEDVGALRTDLTLADKWLTDMADMAAKNSLHIQYCMATTPFAIASARYQAVTQARASDDYAVDLKRDHQQPVNLYVWTSSLLAHALLLHPSKDVFWSQSTPINHPKYGMVSEPQPEAHALVATYTTGPVAVGDAIGMINTSLVMRSCTADGTLLPPSSPAIATDSYFAQRAFGSGGPKGEMSVSQSTVAGTVAMLHVIALDLEEDYELEVTALEPQIAAGGHKQKWISFRHTVAGGLAMTNPAIVESTMTVSRSQLPDLSLYHLAPVVAGWAVMGEVDKWVPVSPVRFLDIRVVDPGLEVDLKCFEEKVGVRFAKVDQSEIDVVDVVCEVESCEGVKSLLVTPQTGQCQPVKH